MRAADILGGVALAVGLAALAPAAWQYLKPQPVDMCQPLREVAELAVAERQAGHSPADLYEFYANTRASCDAEEGAAWCDRWFSWVYVTLHTTWDTADPTHVPEAVHRACLKEQQS